MVAIHRPALPPGQAFGRTLTSKTSLAVAAALALGFAGLQVNQFSRVTTTGYAIGELERTRAEKLAEVHELEAEVAHLSSLARVDFEARTRLRMEPATRRLYIAVNQPPPQRQTLPTRYLPED
jgi:hypothetical protein